MLPLPCDRFALQMVVTDSIPQELNQAKSSKIKVISLAPLLAKVAARLHLCSLRLEIRIAVATGFPATAFYRVILQLERAACPQQQSLPTFQARKMLGPPFSGRA